MTGIAIEDSEVEKATYHLRVTATIAGSRVLDEPGFFLAPRCSR